MTEYELADLMVSTTGNATPVLAMFITFVSGYLAVAWLVGHQLTRAQVMLINVLFLCVSVLAIFGWVARFRAALAYQNELLSLNPSRTGSLSEELIAVISIVMLGLILACLKFMWDVRHPKPE